MAVPMDMNQYQSAITTAFTIAFIQKWMKNTTLYQNFVQAFPGADKYAHWFVAGVMSLVGSVGIHLAWECGLCASYDPMTGGKALVTFPSIYELLHGLWDWFNLYVLQQGAHNIVKARE